MFDADMYYGIHNINTKQVLGLNLIELTYEIEIKSSYSTKKIHREWKKFC